MNFHSLNAGGATPLPRWGHTVLALHQKMYVFGGRLKEEAHLYSFDTGTIWDISVQFQYCSNAVSWFLCT